SPSWNLLSFTDLLAIRAPDFFTGGMDHLNEAILSQVVEESREWINESAGDSDSDISFNERYRYIPDEYLLIDNRILFARSNFENWAFLPDEITRKLDFRYLSGPRKIPVIAVLSAGIPRESSSPEAASLFIQWLLQPETQALLIKRWERDGINVFGFLGGLSSIPEVNESILTLHNPLLKSMIPEGHYLQVPDNRPLRWLRIRDEVVIPWYQSVIYGPENVPSLSEAFEKWDLSSLAETK
ncbi:MAG: hypothetical protein KAH21_07110, partial [Spirochaetaceae bacterium]|nr:hypothetical protein [Spirochaetaceae bacterium]